MESTLDSIRPSENPQEEMSYLFGRDPSILAYSQRPCPSKDTKKNLLSLYETEETESIHNRSENSESQTLQTVKVYLRLKPCSRHVKLTEEQQVAYKIINSTTLVTKLPLLDNNMSSIKQSKSNEIVCRKFIFSQTFGPETTQLELFEQTVQQQMMDFLAGRNCTIMTYGTTNSGKSYTLQGTTTSPGLIPRALEFVFANITTKPHPLYKPVHYCDVVGLNALERAQELEAKTKLLTFSSVDKHQYMNAYRQMQKLLQEESVRPSQCHDAHYSIWVSFAEIYNEIIYDLLSNECQKKRIPLKLGTDSHGRAFIRGLKTVYVNSAAEAYQVLMAGQYNLKVAATALNAKSSRSHCIFTITLLKYYRDNAPDTAEVSTFSFCDLAGSERLKKTLNIGDRLKEAQNINTSLLVLGRCLKSIHEGQLTRTKTDAVGPFRESKLTRLFQRALSGKEHLALIVNINPLPNLYVETQNVLNFAAIAKKIVIEKKETRKKLKTRFSQIVTQSIETVTDWVTELESVNSQQTDTLESGSGYITSEEYTELTNENENLKKEIVILKNSALIRDFQSRQEMADKYVAMINDLEVEWKQRINDVEVQHEDALEWTVNQVKEYYEKKLNELHKTTKRRRTDCSDDSDEDSDCRDSPFHDLNRANQQLKEKIDSLRKIVTELKVANETLNVEKNKACFELGLSKEALKVAEKLYEAAQKDLSLNEDGRIYIDEMTVQLRMKDEQMKKLKEILNEAKAEYITITSDLNKKELCIDEQAKIIIEDEEKIEDLELQLEQANFCLTEKTRIAEILDEKFEQQSVKLSEAQRKMVEMQQEIDRLNSEKSALLESHVSSASSTRTEYQEIIIKEEFIEDLLEDTNNVTKDTAAETVDEAITENAEELDLSGPDSTKERPSQEGLKLDPQLDINEPLKSQVDIGCQVDMTCNANSDTDKKTKDTQTTITAEEIQTICDRASSKEESVQTDEMADEVKLQLEEMTARRDEIRVQYEQECSKVEKLAEELRDMEETVQTLKGENRSTNTIVIEYKHLAETLEEQLALSKRQMEESLQSSSALAERKIADCEREIHQLKKDLSTTKDNAQRYLEDLEASRKEFDNYILKCKEENEEKARGSDDILVPAEEEESSDVDAKQKEATQLERSLEIAKLKDDIVELNGKLQTCQAEKDDIVKTLEENDKRLMQLEKELQASLTKEHEKEMEIIAFQKELKSMIQKDTDSDRMEAEFKSTMNELTRTRETLSEKEQYIKELKIHLENFERNAKILNLLEANAKDRQVENERLRNANDELKSILAQKEREMDAFMKNRDETVTKYENLVKNQQEELDREKREVMRYQELFRRQLTPTPNKDNYKLQNRLEVLEERQKCDTSRTRNREDPDIVSEDEVEKKTKRRQGNGGRKAAATAAEQDDVSVIELSGSETKRSTRRNRALLPPESSTESKRTTRKKKLFVADDSITDIECVEPIPSLSTRNLRSRKK